MSCVAGPVTASTSRNVSVSPARVQRHVGAVETIITKDGSTEIRNEVVDRGSVPSCHLPPCLRPAPGDLRHSMKRSEARFARVSCRPWPTGRS